MKITVTQQDIDSGVPEDCRNCAIVRSLSRQTNLKPIIVNAHSYANRNRYKSAFIETGPHQKEIPLPKECANFMYKFDNYKKVKPFSFELDIPEIEKI